MNIHHYLPFDKFIFRTPLFPFNRITQFNPTDEIFEEAIFIASPDLYDLRQRQTPKIIQSLYKYHLRASTRSTPFGLFAACSIGDINDMQSLCVITNPSQVIRHTRLDMCYLSILIQYIESISEIQNKLKYYPNDSIYELDDKIRYVEYTHKNNRRVHQLQELSHINYVKVILNNASHGATIDELSQSIVDEEISIEEAHDFINQLIDNQILKSEIEIYLTGEDALTALINTLMIKNTQKSDINESLVLMSKLLSQMDLHNRHQDDIYSEFIRLINKFPIDYDKQTLLQTDAYRESKAAISTEVVEEMKDTIEFILRICNSLEYKNLRLEEFIKEFEDRYGEQEIPILEALDPDIGIGYPVRTVVPDINPLLEGISFPISKEDSYNLSSIQSIILRKYYDQLKNGERNEAVEIVLSDKDFEGDNGFVETRILSPTCKMMLNIMYDHTSHKYTYYIKTLGGPTATNYLSRFSYLNSEISKFVEEISIKEQELTRDNGVIAEIVHLPQSRIGNIAYRPCFRDLEIHYLAHSGASPDCSLPVSDLVIGLRNHRIYLKSRKHNRLIFPILSNAHNYNIDSVPVYLFLCEMQHYCFQDNLSIPSMRGILDILNYIPRIKYKNCYLHLQTWKISIGDITTDDSIIDIKKLNSRNIPNRFVVKESDNELFVDLQIPQSRDLFVNMLHKKDLIIEEFLYDNDSSIITDGENKYCGEFIFSFFRNPDYDNS